ncbi:DUF1127 domain-containing protein [Thalassospiraceae bacterium LMO-SO8]|nr:DUF1127 domain-containing protein [Alphaproteobacteria bacterium LMO-S08]WND74611.1 DUF1127 domain-containing protein [Thalassospiraceae bacterium LMO-SO8]
MFDGIPDPCDLEQARRAVRRRPWRIRLTAWLRLCRDKARQRRALARLDTRLLTDIGISPAEAARECAKPFWR